MIYLIDCKDCPLNGNCKTQNMAGDMEGCCVGSYSGDMACRSCDRKEICRDLTKKSVLIMEELP